jgi:hypothetical protein
VTGQRPHALGLLAAAAAAIALGCTDTSSCPANDSFIVDENGTCSAAPIRFTLATIGCRIFVQEPNGMTGLPQQGAMGPHPAPVRQGGFLLYDDMPSFRLCRARRVDYWLELSCVDDNGDAVCQSNLTEPGP